MKQKFSNKWIGSKQPRKQRKYRANAPIHLRINLMSANLSKDLRKRYEKRSFPIRKEDRVKVMRGEFKGKTGKINLIDLKKYRVAIDGIQKSKKDGTKVNVYFAPSNLQVQELNLDDVKRKKSLERKSISPQTEKQKSEKKITEKTTKEQNKEEQK